MRPVVGAALQRPLLPLEPWAGTASTAARQRVLEAEASVLADLREGRRPVDAERLRFEAYAHGSTSFGDRWATTRVARAEELLAEAARQRGRLQDAWLAWRTSWWIRRSLGSPGQPERDRVMALLHLATGRLDSARERLEDARDGLIGEMTEEVSTLWRLLSSHDNR
jgi:hypothetical protein